MYSILIAFVICSSISAFSIVQQPPFSHTLSSSCCCSSSIQIQQNDQSYLIYPNSRSNRKTLLFASDIKDSSSDVKAEDSNKTSSISSSSSSTTSELTTTTTTKEDEDDDEEWEYVEYENLKESDFYNSEWKVGTLFDGSNNIQETWARLIVQEGEFICVWGDGANGKWNFDASSQFLSLSKDTIGGWLGKKIWAGTVEDYYYLQGTVRGWSPISPASVIGQWQMKRLGVDKEEAGIAPWFEEDENEEKED